MPSFGKITTFAGTGLPAYNGDNGPANKAGLNNPFYCAFDTEGNLFIGESGNNTVRRVEKRTARITTVAGMGAKGFEGDKGPALRAAFNDVVAIAVDKNGDLYIVDRLNARVRRVDARTQLVTTIAGNGMKAFSGDGGTGSQASLKEPHDCVLDGKGGLLIADVADCRVRRIDLHSGIITTSAGDGKRLRAGDSGPALAASFAGTRALAVDPKNDIVYVCEREGNGIRRIDGKTGIVSLYAGTGKKGYEGDGGPASRATFNGPKSLCCDKQGNLYVVDTENHAIRCIEAATGVITTVAGGRKSPDGDNGSAIAAGLNRPHGAVIGPDNALYIADSENHRVRRVEPLTTKS